MNDASDVLLYSSDDAYLKSMFYEQLVEHVFISEILQEVWYSFGKTAEVLRSEVDSSGYDVVFECNGVLRHVQLKTSKADAKASGQKVNVALAEKPSGCIVWILRREDRKSHRMQLSYLFFGGKAGEPLRPLDGFKVGKHSKANSQGVKKERAAIRVVPKSQFEEVPTTKALVAKLFGLATIAGAEAVEPLELASLETEADND